MHSTHELCQYPATRRRLLPLAFALALSAVLPATAEPLAVEGRFYCSVRRPLVFPFGGVVEEMACEVGQAVTNGQPLIRYRLFPEAAQELSRRLNPSQVDDVELQQVQTEDRLEEAKRRLEETRRQVELKITSPAQLELTEREVSTLQKKTALLTARAATERRLADEDAAMLRTLLASPLPTDVTPDLVWLTAPLDGHVISIDPQIAPGSERLQHAPALQVGVMDPMILRAEVHEREAVRLQAGAPAKITVHSLSDQLFNGTLRHVFWAPAERGLNDPAYFEIEVVVANPGLDIKEGFQGRLEFDLP